MFTLTVTEKEIQDTLAVLEQYIYPSSIKLWNISALIYGNGISPIAKRKVRLSIEALRKQGYLIIAKRGYSMAGDDPTEVIHFINGLYSRANKLTTEADIMFHGLKQKYGDAVALKVEQLPGQPAIQFNDDQPDSDEFDDDDVLFFGAGRVV